jgi:hypothetical protein
MLDYLLYFMGAIGAIECIFGVSFPEITESEAKNTLTAVLCPEEQGKFLSFVINEFGVEKTQKIIDEILIERN